MLAKNTCKISSLICQLPLFKAPNSFGKRRTGPSSEMSALKILNACCRMAILLSPIFAIHYGTKISKSPYCLSPGELETSCTMLRTEITILKLFSSRSFFKNVTKYFRYGSIIVKFRCFANTMCSISYTQLTRSRHCRLFSIVVISC